MIPLFGIEEIINDFYATLKTKTSGFYFYFPFWIIPIILGLLFTFYIDYKIGIDFLNPILTAIAILVGFLFNMILVMYDISSRNEITLKDVKELIKTTYYSLIYGLTIGVIIVGEIIIITLTQIFDKNLIFPLYFFQYILSFILYFLLIHFTVVLFMILRRVHKLMKKSMGVK